MSLFVEQSRSVNRVLNEHWDPIGVFTNADAAPRDEYSSYVPQLIGLMMHGATDAAAAELLGELESKNMGVGVSPVAKRLDVAARIRVAMFGSGGARPNG